MLIALWFVTGRGRGWEKVMCDAVRVMVCYRVGEREGKGDVCCIQGYVCYREEEREGNFDV